MERKPPRYEPDFTYLIDMEDFKSGWYTKPSEGMLFSRPKPIYLTMMLFELSRISSDSWEIRTKEFEHDKIWSEWREY